MRRHSYLLVSSLALLIAGCAAAGARTPPPGMGVTSLQAPERPAGAGDVQLAKSPLVETAHPLANDVAGALVAKDYAKVLSLTETVSLSPEGAWLRYDRASALAGLGRTDDAVNEFDRAELRFIQNDDEAGRATAIWGRARALAEAGRCAEARRAYDEYVGLMRSRDSDSAQMAIRYAAACRAPVIQR